MRQRQVFLQKWVGLPIGRRLSGRPRGPNDEQDPDKAVEVVGQSAYVSESLQHDDVSKVSGGASSKVRISRSQLEHICAYFLVSLTSSPVLHILTGCG